MQNDRAAAADRTQDLLMPSKYKSDALPLCYNGSAILIEIGVYICIIAFHNFTLGLWARTGDR